MSMHWCVAVLFFLNVVNSPHSHEHIWCSKVRGQSDHDLTILLFGNKQQQRIHIVVRSQLSTKIKLSKMASRPANKNMSLVSKSKQLHTGTN